MSHNMFVPSLSWQKDRLVFLGKMAPKKGVFRRNRFVLLAHRLRVDYECLSRTAARQFSARR
jgi:hypothetical protein